MKKILVTGATGQIGGELVSQTFHDWAMDHAGDFARLP